MNKWCKLSALAVAAAVLPWSVASAADIDAARLNNADKDADNWLSYHGSYSRGITAHSTRSMPATSAT
jgi:hypothetical protein